MVLVQFIFCAAIIVTAAIKLAEYGDVISIRTGMGGMFIGLILMAGATSLPELLTTINSINQGIPDLAAGNLFGSCMFNMLLLGTMDLMNIRTRILRKVARRHALSGSMAAFLITLAVILILADIDISIGWIGLDSLVLVGAYIAGIQLIRHTAAPIKASQTKSEEEPEPIDESVPSLKRGLIGFGISTIVLLLVMPFLVQSSNEIAEITGLGTGFIGTALVAIITSLPELVATITAVRLKVYDMAIGNLFGSNMFNIFVLGLSDLFMFNGRFLNVIADDFVLVGLLGLLLTIMGLVGNLARLERRLWILEFDALMIIVVYILGMLLIYTYGIGI